MKQILQNLSTGETSLVEAPSPSVKVGHCNIETSTSLISAGTERMLVSFGQSNLLNKARQQPEKVNQVIDKIKTDGLFSTIDAVSSKLSEPLPLGYCNVGRVKALGEGVEHLRIGDRVVSNGAHASVVRVAKNLCAKIPENVCDEQAAFTVVASIALQGIRLAQPTLGEHFVVIGAGLIGLCAIQLLRANGCKVLAIDFDEKKLKLAQQMGAEICNPLRGEDPVTAGLSFSQGVGADAVIVTASTKSSDPISQAAQMCRKRGRIILIGVTGLELNRTEFYEKELSFQVSCSYGPGRYDAEYEVAGHDYPIGFVRWTEQRNFEAILGLLSAGQLDFKPLISHCFAFSSAPAAYKTLTDDPNALGILLTYTDQNETKKFSNRISLNENISFQAQKPILGFIGAGNYASRVLIPAFKNAGAQLHTLVTSSGANSVVHGSKLGFANASTDVSGVLEDKDINTMVIITRHNTHAKFVVDALQHNKHVFVEKPLALNLEELESVKAAWQEAQKPLLLLVGFNRRFAPQVRKMKQLLSAIHNPKSFVMTINAGEISADHWTQDIEVGGGRIIGEACHFIDLMRHLSGSEITDVKATRMMSANKINDDKSVITLNFADGSFGSIHYLANGHSAFPKERIEVFVDGKVLQLDNFRKLTGWGFSGFSKMNLWRQDKGQKQCVAEYLKAISDGAECPIPASEIFEVAEVTIKAATLLK